MIVSSSPVGDRLGLGVADESGETCGIANRQTNSERQINGQTFIGKIDTFLCPTLASMPLQKTMHFFRELRTDSFGRGDLFHARFAQSIYRTEFSQQQVLPVLTDAWTIIKNTFVDSLLQQQLMISVRKSVCFVANSLQQMQSARIDRQLQRQRVTRSINLFVLLGQTDNWQIMQAEPL